VGERGRIALGNGGAATAGAAEEDLFRIHRWSSREDQRRERPKLLRMPFRPKMSTLWATAWVHVPETRVLGTPTTHRRLDQN
jgi:hypothetical protein